MLPPGARLNDLRADYRAMAPMMFDEKVPGFDDVLDKIAQLQNAINSSD
jgi:hypothetical protein